MYNHKLDDLFEACDIDKGEIEEVKNSIESVFMRLGEGARPSEIVESIEKFLLADYTITAKALGVLKLIEAVGSISLNREKSINFIKESKVMGNC